MAEIRIWGMMTTLFASAANYVVNRPTRAPRRWNVDPRRIKSNRLWKQMKRWRRDNRLWQLHVGMTYKTFLVVLKELKPMLEPNGRHHRAVKLKKKLLCVLVILHSGCSQHEAVITTGQSQPTISCWLTQIVDALNDIKDTYIQLPRTFAECETIARGFQGWANSQFPMCVGAIDGTHIAVQSDDISHLNCKGYKSINMQVICDDQMLIRSVFGGYSGNFSDKMVFRQWEERIQFVDYISRKLPGRDFNGTNVLVCFCLVGDGGYTLRPGCQIPFAGYNTSRLTPEMRDWNFWLSSNRMIIEQCFGHLKGRFGILVATHRASYTPEKVNRIFTACCVLHNMCILESD